MLRRELVDDEAWVSSSRFNRLLAVYQVLPGPEAHELCVHLGIVKGGRVGGLLAGLGFMLPGFVLMTLLSWLYFRIDLSQAAIGSVFLGVQVAVIALIVRAIHRIGRHVLASPWLWMIGAAAALATLMGVGFWLVLPVAGVVHVSVTRPNARLAMVAAGLAVCGAVAIGLTALPGGPLAPNGAGPSVGSPAGYVEPSLLALFVSGLKAGLLTFGGAYTVIPFLREDAVGSGWLTDARFLDGLALSGILPAPLIIFSTFVGFVAGSFAGALAMTVGIFLPAFAFSLVLGDRIEAVIENERLHSFLEGVAAAVVGLIVVTALELSATTIGRLPWVLPGILIFGASLAALFRFSGRAAVPAVIAAAAAAGWLSFDVLG
jgi:chromate transporter